MIDGRLRQIFQEHLPAVHWQSIETGLTGRGIPDLNGCYQGTEFWVENKRTAHWSIPLEAEQVGWHLRRHRAGGRTFIAVRRMSVSGQSPTDELWLLPGRLAREAKVGGLRAFSPSTPTAALGAWSGGPARWDWPEVLRLLVL